MLTISGLLSSLGVGGSGNSASATATAAAAAGSSALARARLLAVEAGDRRNASTHGGEVEGHQWWVANADLFEAARLEYGPLHPSLYDFERHVDDFVQPQILSAVTECERAAAAGGGADVADAAEDALRSLLKPAGAPNVWRLPLLTPRFCDMLLEELRHYEASGIPLRRPNGMNRFGAILDHLGLERSLE